MESKPFIPAVLGLDIEDFADVLKMVFSVLSKYPWSECRNTNVKQTNDVLIVGAGCIGGEVAGKLGRYNFVIAGRSSRCFLSRHYNTK
jgi:hypothetical protein